MLPKMIPNPNYLSTGIPRQLRLNKSEIIMGKAVRVMILKALCSLGECITSCTDSFLCDQNLFVSFKSKTLVRKCFIGWRSSCLAAGLIFEDKHDVSGCQPGQGILFNFSEVANKFKKEILREAVVVIDLLLPMLTPSPSLHLFTSPE